MFAPGQGVGGIIVDHHKLKKDLSEKRFQTYLNEDSGVFLYETNNDASFLAAEVGYAAGKMKISNLDFVTYMGPCDLIAGAAIGRGCFYPNKIVDSSDGSLSYPDLLYAHPFSEGTLLSGPNHANDALRINFRASDALSASVFKAASMFVKLNRIFILNVCGDNWRDAVLCALRWLDEIFSAEKSETPSGMFTEAERALMDKIKLSYRLTDASSVILTKKAARYKSHDGDLNMLLLRYSLEWSGMKEKNQMTFRRLIDELDESF